MTQADKLIQAAHDARDTSYPVLEDMTLDQITQVVRGVMDVLVDGKTAEALTGLAFLVDTLENVKPRVEH